MDWAQVGIPAAQCQRKKWQERLGHADIGVTLGTYTHVVSEQHREAGKRLDEVFALITPSCFPTSIAMWSVWLGATMRGTSMHTLAPRR